MAKKYYPLGSMTLKKEKDADGNPQYVIKLDKKVAGKLKIDGKPVLDFIDVERPMAKFDRMLKAGKITEEEYDQKVEDFGKGGKLEFIKFDLQIKVEE